MGVVYYRHQGEQTTNHQDILGGMLGEQALLLRGPFPRPDRLEGGLPVSPGVSIVDWLLDRKRYDRAMFKVGYKRGRAGERWWGGSVKPERSAMYRGWNLGARVSRHLKAYGYEQ